LGFEGVTPSTTGRPSYHPGSAAKNIHLRLPQPDSIESPPGARMSAQC
jgi:hypothetical protein